MSGPVRALASRQEKKPHRLKSLKRNIPGFVGISPIKETLIGMVDKLGEEGVQKWAQKLRKLGAWAQ